MLFELRLLLGFPLVFECVSYKTCFSNTSGTMSIVKVYVSKDCLFLPFWTLIGGRIRSLVTANRYVYSRRRVCRLSKSAMQPHAEAIMEHSAHKPKIGSVDSSGR